MTSLSPDHDAVAFKRVTIRDVARAAGVGTKTVSRVVNAEPNVSTATADRVRNAIAELRWEPDAHASNLRRINSRTRSLGVLLGNVANPFSAQIHRAIEDVATHRDVAVFASSLDEDPEREVAAVAAFVKRKTDGLILTCAAPSQEYLREYVPPHVPIVFIDRKPTGFSSDVVRSDNRGGAAQATRHLLSQGHRRIGLLLDREDLWTARERRLGFLDALRDYGLSPDASSIVFGLETVEQAEATTLSLLARPDAPTAVFSAQNLITIGAVHALRKLGRQRDVALIGFDDIELGDLLDPGISVVAQHPAEIGRAAAERMFARLDAQEPSAPVEVALPVELIPRGSGEIRPPL